ncbi:hypothetical protein LMG3431_02344 [Achromobacter pestifer]|uniref:Uncharacterized protein n=1 Tax=Achromobacter pestifer TaxID=1353889 RepID=A0A6S6YTU3_9BURK|nr:hypothetical protein LMG3431_02344 [Achromobacter pestifer]
MLSASIEELLISMALRTVRSLLLSDLLKLETATTSRSLMVVVTPRVLAAMTTSPNALRRNAPSTLTLDSAPSVLSLLVDSVTDTPDTPVILLRWV